MAIPLTQLNKRKRRPKHKVRATDTKPPSIKRPPFGYPKPQPPTTSSRRVLDYEGLRAKGINYHPNYLRRLWYAGKFPAPFYPTPRRLAWYEDVIDAWLQAAVGGTAVEPDQETAALQSKLAALDPDQVQAAGLTVAERATLATILRKVLGGSSGSSVDAAGSPSKQTARQHRNRGARQ